MPFNYLWSLLVIAWLLLVPTNITRISSDTTVLEGDNLQLTCKASGLPQPIITWTREKPGNQGNTGVVQEGEVLTITNINRNDSGTFTCTADNGFGKPEKRTVHVNVTCEYALKKCMNNVKQRCTFLLFSVLQCVLLITWNNVWPNTFMQGSKLKFLKITFWRPSVSKWSPEFNLHYTKYVVRWTTRSQHFHLPTWYIK